MRTLALSLTFVAVSALTACSSNERQPVNQTTTSTTTTQTAPPSAPAADNSLPIAPAHGGGTTTAPAAANSSPAEETGMDTAALDAKIKQAEEKAKASAATQADKAAAAAAYLERGNIFYNAGRPMLYKFALRDFRRALRYQPDNAEARSKRDQIVDIYTNSLRRPVPELGNEP